MPYCTLDDIKKHIPEDVLVELTDDEGLGTINTQRGDQAIADADSEIDAYCGVRYSVPFQTAPQLIRKLSIDIAIYNLFSRSRLEPPELRKDRYHQAIDTLKGIAKGTVSIGIDPRPPAHSENTIQFSSNDKLFTREKLEDY